MAANGSISVDFGPETSKEKLNISFTDITYTVRTGIFSRKRKEILRGVSGSFNAGELSVVVGQSGAGKSTLMDILSGYTKATSGMIRVNGQERDDRWFRRRACYIMQDDMLQDWLTVRESLEFAANFKLGNNIDVSLKNKRINKLLKALLLEEVESVKAGSLSGGQKKRLAIALELVSDPPVLFFDEPISGLDCSTSYQLVRLLRQLARQDRTLVATMHQPSAALLMMVDRLYAVTGGCCAYMGSVERLKPYLTTLDLNCPPYHNAVDFLMELCTGSPDVNMADQLVGSSENGKKSLWLSNGLTAFQKSPFNFDSGQTKKIAPPVESKHILYMSTRRYATSFWTQTSLLFRRSLKVVWRDRSHTATRVTIHLAIALLVGCLYFNIGREAKHMRNNYNFLYFSLMFLMFTAFSGVTLSFPSQLPLVRRENFNRWYSSGAFFMATLLSAAPLQAACSLLYTLIAYWLTDQPLEWYRFLGFSWMLILVSFVSMCIGLLNGSIFDIKNGVVFGPLMIMPFTVFSGFFLSYQDAPWWLRWAFPLSFLKHGLDGLCAVIFGHGRGNFKCSEDYCHYKSPKFFMKDFNIIAQEYGVAVGYLFLILFIVIFLAYFVLKLRLRHRW